MWWQKERGAETLQTHLEPLEEVPFSWDTSLFGGDKRGGRRNTYKAPTPEELAGLQTSKHMQCLAWEGQLHTSILLLPKPQAALGHHTSQSKNNTWPPQPAACLHRLSCLLPAYIQACRGGNGPCHNSQQHPAPSPFGEGSAAISQASKPVLGCWRTQ